MKNYLLEEIHRIVAKNKLNTGVQTYVKTTGDAFVNPINYPIDQVISWVANFKGSLITRDEKYTMPAP